jgi:hypothetical protein
MQLRTLILPALLALFTGCLTIEENYTFKKNGSGTMEYVLDLSEMGEMLKAFGGDEAGKDKGGNMDMSDHAARLRQLPGISKVKLDSKEWVQRISFSFKDLDALNAALNVLMPDSVGTHTFFAWEGNTLVRTSNRYAHSLGAGMAEASDEGDNGEEGFSMATMLDMMKYKYSFKFANAIEPVAVADGVHQETKGTKQVFVDTDFGVIAKDPKALDLRIPVKR